MKILCYFAMILHAILIGLSAHGGNYRAALANFAAFAYVWVILKLWSARK